MTDKIHIILPVHNRCNTTAKFVECLKQQTHFDYHLILIDDGSSDGTAEMVRQNIEQLTVISGDGALWWAGSLQAGYEWLKARPETFLDSVLIINDDTVFEPDFMEVGVKLLNKYRESLVSAYCYSQQTGELLDSGIHVNWFQLKFERASQRNQINCVSTRGLFLGVSDFIRTGGFYPKLLPHYASDYEFTIRAQRKGMCLVTDPTLKLWVDETTTGCHEIVLGTFMSMLGNLLSNRTLANPLRWALFIILACPVQWKALNLMRVCWGTLLQFALFLRFNKKSDEAASP